MPSLVFPSSDGSKKKSLSALRYAGEEGVFFAFWILADVSFKSTFIGRQERVCSVAVITVEDITSRVRDIHARNDSSFSTNFTSETESDIQWNDIHSSHLLLFYFLIHYIMKEKSCQYYLKRLNSLTIAS